MSTIFQTYINALLADATYALGAAVQGDLTGATGSTLTGYLNDRMTPTLAQYIGDHYTVVSHKETGDVLGSGFDATVWKDNATGKLIVSMQGTTGLQDFLTDVNLAASSNVQAQFVDMVNWWFKISTPAGQNARQITLEPIYDNSTPPIQLGTHYVAAPDVTGSGLISATDLAQGIEVNGHSLGGYLCELTDALALGNALSKLDTARATVTNDANFRSAA